MSRTPIAASFFAVIVLVCAIVSAADLEGAGAAQNRRNRAEKDTYVQPE